MRFIWGRGALRFARHGRAPKEGLGVMGSGVRTKAICAAVGDPMRILLMRKATVLPLLVDNPPGKRKVVGMAAIFVVDDYEVHREALRAFLGRRGHEVVTAADGAEALERLKSWRPDLI